jgi:phosphoglycolate phosphatase
LIKYRKTAVDIPESAVSFKTCTVKRFAASKPAIFAEKILKHFKMDSYFDQIAVSSLDGTLIAKSDIIAEVLKHYPVNPKSEI